MSENTETTGAPPKGYFRCPQKCGRWTAWSHAEEDLVRCNHCTAKDDVAMLANMESACGPDWTPPVAQPPAAAHVERRAGQRWEYQFQDDEPLYDVVLTGRCEPNAWATEKHGMIFDAAWSDTSVRMTLLADAPPEPAKPCVCPHGPRVSDGKCPIHVTAGIPSMGFVGCECAKCSPPAQEAPKAAPVCKDCGGSGPTVIMRAFLDGPMFQCQPCMLSYEGDESSGVLHSDDVPERLPRPRLAADWVEDCLGDVR